MVRWLLVEAAWCKEVIVDEEELMTRWETREPVRPPGKLWSGGWMVQAWWNLV